MKYWTILLKWVACTLIFGSLSLNAQSKLVINGAFITLNGGTSTVPIYLVVEDSISNAVVRNSGHIISSAEFNFLKRNLDTFQNAYLYPFGDGITDYIPFTYTKTDNSPVKLSFSTWSTNMQNNPHPIGVNSMIGAGDSLTSAIDRFWNMESNNSTNGDFTFSYIGTENTTTNPITSTFSAQYWDGSDWSAAPAGGSNGVTTGIGNTTLPFSSSTGIYPFVLTRTGFSLPIELLSFTAIWVNDRKNESQLNWITSSEINTSHFEIQRSVDGMYYAPIGIVKAAGNSNTMGEYIFYDTVKNLNSKEFLYRLKIIDNNGQFNFSNIEVLDRNSGKKVIVNVFPNPFTETINIHFSSKPYTPIQINLFDLAGKLILQPSHSSIETSDSHVISLSQLSAGIYFLNLTFNRETHQIKLFKY